MSFNIRLTVVIGYLMLQMWGSFVYSDLGPPCMSHLGLKYGSSDVSLYFDLDTSSGYPEGIRLNSPEAWVPLNFSGSFIEINISEPVLLTGLQLQGDPHSTGLITEWILETSLDCETYHTENYSIDSTSSSQLHTVTVKHLEFVFCIRLKPTRYKGNVPALRLELLGCALNDNSKCDRDVHPTTEIYMEDGVRQLNFDQDVILAWVKVELEFNMLKDTEDVGLSYSRSCDKWTSYELSDMNIVSITSADKKSRSLTIEMDTPVRARCLRIFPPPSAKLQEVHTAGCNLHLKSSLIKVKSETNNQGSPVGDEDAKKEESALSNSTEKLSSTYTSSITNDTSQDGLVTNSHINSTVTDASTVSEPTEASKSENTKPSTAAETTLTLTKAESNITAAASSLEANETQVSNKNVSLEEFSNFTLLTLTYSNGSSDIENISEPETSMSLNFSSITISTAATTLPVQETAYLDKNNYSSEDSVKSYGRNGISKTEEQHSNSKAAEIKDVNGKNSTNENSTSHYNSTYIDAISTKITDGNETANKPDNSSSDWNFTEPQYNISSVTQNTDLGLKSINDSETNSFRDRDNNQSDCGVRKQPEHLRKKRVVSGRINDPGQWPWLVSLHYLKEFHFTRRSGFKHTCGASLIAPNWILTAAHCFSDELLDGLSNLSNWRVYFGMHDLARVGSDQDFVQERLIQAVYIYPYFNILSEPLIYDVAVIKLNESVEINERVSPVCLDNTDLYYQEHLCYLSGWGQPTTKLPGSRYPYTAALSTMTLSRCNETYSKLPDSNEIKKYVIIKPPVLCAAVGNNGEDACMGDSGGPLMCEHDGHWFQSGIVAGGHECGHKETPGLYSRISFYADWIIDTMKNNSD